MGERDKNVTEMIGETLFRQYLVEHQLPFDYEPKAPIGEKRPDFQVHVQRTTVMCEVADFREGELSGTFGVGPTVSHIYDRIIGKIRRELEQLAPFRGRFPGVVILHAPASSEVWLTEAALLDALSEMLRPGQHTEASAIGMIEAVQPLAGEYTRVVNGLYQDEGRRRPGLGEWRRPTLAELVRGIEAHQKLREEWGPAFTEWRPQLLLFHNPYAAVLLPAAAFPGSLVIQKRLVPDKRGGRFGAIEIRTPRRSRDR